MKKLSFPLIVGLLVGGTVEQDLKISNGIYPPNQFEKVKNCGECHNCTLMMPLLFNQEGLDLDCGISLPTQ